MRRRALLVPALVAAGLLSAGATPAAAAGPPVRVADFGANPGALQMYVHRPAGLPAGAPVVVALHGCTQDAAGYALGSGWPELADRWGFTVVLPQQVTANNANRCFTWFQPGDVTRGQGEVASIRSMVAHAVTAYGADPGRVFVTGLSAGGAMSAALLAAYPDVFAAGAVIAGVPVGCADDLLTALACMTVSGQRTPGQWADAVRAAAPAGTTEWPEVSVWQGTDDRTVNPANALDLRDQWTAVHGLPQVPSSITALPAGTTRARYADAGGTVRVTTYTVVGMGHATPNDPGTGPRQCGRPGRYFAGTVCSSWYDGVSWGLDQPGGTPYRPARL
ncbi:extracellular catalytic domain type 1 short-chain-length polyhydroxyalkanoate depolymerase [Geodermatophilus sp. URMC 62]|uniref:extracellular catalytic domain type 1 short-chain-length polyhydroxyalkanoate depolymerase n=1 Tax=Geodermatophilus sp. URMC 62 TaxID=3423414 RepID=UPI00406CBA05